MAQQATVQFFFRCPAALAERFAKTVENMSPKPSRNAVLTYLVEQWVKTQEEMNA